MAADALVVAAGVLVLVSYGCARLFRCVGLRSHVWLRSCDRSVVRLVCFVCGRRSRGWIL